MSVLIAEVNIHKCQDWQKHLALKDHLDKGVPGERRATGNPKTGFKEHRDLSEPLDSDSSLTELPSN